MKDLSALFDRPDEKKKNGLFSFLKMKNKPKLPTTGSIIAQGRILFDPQQLFTPEGKLLPLADIPERLRYDLYMKTVRAPFRWQETFQDGAVTAFLHLGNRNGEDGQPLHPLLEGLIYAENATISSAKSTSDDKPFTYPMDPELSIALLAGKGNEFTMSSPAFSAALQFVPTSLPAPISNLEKENAALPSGQKLPIDKDYMYVHNAAALQQLASNYPVHDSQGIGTWGIVTGRLSAPTIDVNFQIDPPRSLVQLPGGNSPSPAAAAAC